MSEPGVPSTTEGAEAAFEREALPEMEAVFGFALRLSGGRDQAQDLVQETYLRAWRSWDRYTPGTRIRSWLFTICRNLFYRREQRSRRHHEIVKQIAEEEPASVAMDAVVYRATRSHDPQGAFWDRILDVEVLRALDALPPPFREALILADLESLPYDEIATVLDVAVGTVKSRIFRARRMMQEQLYDYAISRGIIPGPTPRTSTPPSTDPESA
ncbi:MAG: sigma-70 family RNA polymerase sigma factor [Gemmatimonadales bacterium]|nr:MAG: sigma-70 family RNA polymerase sigma factor [Gemmatimonadales bacterium]